MRKTPLRRRSIIPLAAGLSLLLALAPTLLIARCMLSDNGVYRLKVVTWGDFSGAYAAMTSDLHPVTARLGRPGDVLAVLPTQGGSDFVPTMNLNTVRSWRSATDYPLAWNPNMCVLPTPGFECMPLALTQSPEVFEIREAGHIVGTRLIWEVNRFPDHLMVEQIVRLRGKSLSDSALQITLRLENLAAEEAVLGIRYAWDLLIKAELGSLAGGTEGAYLRLRPPDPPLEPFADQDWEWLDPTFRSWEAYSFPEPSVRQRWYSIGGTVGGPTDLQPPPTPPSAFQFGELGAGFDIIDGFYDACFDGPLASGLPHDIGVDRGLAYLWGDREDNALRLGPGESVSVTQYVFAYLDYPISCSAGEPLVVECAGPETEVPLAAEVNLLEPGVPFRIRWSSPDGLLFDDPEALEPGARAPGPGLYEAVLESAVGPYGCESRTTVEIVDTIPPEFTRLEAEPDLLWPPNHKIREVKIRFAATDVCDPSPAVTLISLTSSEPDDARGVGDGHTLGDIQAADIGDPDEVVLLRAERGGGGSGRIYTMTYEAQDASRNTTRQAVEVVVPHDRSSPK